MGLSNLFTLVGLICFFSLHGQAKVVFYIFDRGEAQPALVFPAADHESLEVQIERYFERIRNTADLMILEPDFAMLRSQLDPQEAQLLTMNLLKKNIALIANKFSDFDEMDKRVGRHKTFFDQAPNTVSYLLPLAGDLHLNGYDKIDYRAQVRQTFPRLLVSMGGDDVKPRLYNEKHTYSGRVSYTRDYSEVMLIRSYTAEGNGLHLGICRGHQIAAVARGDHMNQDLSKDGVADTNDHSMNGDFHSKEERWHPIEVVHPLLIQLFGQRHFEVNSYHHQSVKLAPGSSSMMGAYSSSDGVVEALVSENGQSIGLQFHLEIPPTSTGKEAFSAMATRFVNSLMVYSDSIQFHTPRYRSCRVTL